MEQFHLSIRMDSDLLSRTLNVLTVNVRSELLIHLSSDRNWFSEKLKTLSLFSFPTAVSYAPRKQSIINHSHVSSS